LQAVFPGTLVANQPLQSRFFRDNFFDKSAFQPRSSIDSGGAGTDVKAPDLGARRRLEEAAVVLSIAPGFFGSIS
jgi:hypothetical protein